MRNLTSIVAVNYEGVIGAQNSLPWRVKSDLRFFRERTLDQTVIMGRKTHTSLGGCLPKRLNVVVTHGFGLFPESANCIAAGSITEALARAEAKRLRKQDVFVIGGATMYEQFAPFVDRYLITEIDKSVPEGDTWLRTEIIGDLSDWNLRDISQGQANEELGDEVGYRIYELTSKRATEIARAREDRIREYFQRSHQRSAEKYKLPTARLVA